jgi:hypothetical protein
MRIAVLQPKCLAPIFLACFAALFALAVTLPFVARAQDLEILSFHGNGLVTWSNAPAYSNRTYRIEWCADLRSNQWISSWSDLTSIPHSTNGMSAAVPMFYRVVMNQRTLVVATNGSDSVGQGSPDFPFATLQKAIDVAATGDRVLVRAGKYSGTGNRDLSIVGKNIDVVSESGPLSTTIDCGGATRAVTFSGSISEMTLSGFTIKNGYYSEGGDWGYGGIIRVNDPAAPTISNCIIVNNTVVSSFMTAQPGLLAIVTSGPASVRNCLIVSNSVSGGTYSGGGMGAIIRSDGDTGSVTNSLINCTIADNTLSGHSRVTTLAFRGEIVNVVDWLNPGAQTHTSNLYARYCNSISDTILVAGNTNADPLFAGGQYNLQSGSPAINNGTNMSWMVGAVDLLGNARVQNSTVDLGAMETPY